jgi:hypothetical protein
VLRSVRASYGAWLLLTPAGKLEPVAGRPLDPGAVRFARVLGARQLLQSIWLRRASRSSLLVGATIDTVHALSMVALSRRLSRTEDRAPARRNARTAGLFAIAGIATVTLPSRRSHVAKARVTKLPT